MATTSANCTLQSLKLQKIEMRSVMGMPYGGEYKVNVQKIYFDDNKFINGAFTSTANYLAAFRNLKKLSMKNCGLDDEAVILLC